MKVLLDRQGHQDSEDQAEVDRGADIQSGNLGAVKLPFLIPTKEFSRLQESGENPYPSRASGGWGLGGWSGEQVPMGEGWQMLLSPLPLASTRVEHLHALPSGIQPPPSV